MKPLLFFVIVAGVGLPSCAPHPADSRPNVLFITLDTTRPDHLGCYGNLDAQTPHLDELAENGVLFETAVCQAPLTLPSHASLLTGTYPSFHGVRDNGGFYLDDRMATLAEILRDHGYATAAFVGAFVLDARWGLAQGFDLYDDAFGPTAQSALTLDSVQRRGEEIADAFLEWLDEGSRQPFLAWLHFYDPHTPYEPPEPFRSRFSDRLYDGEIAYVDSQVGRVLDGIIDRAVLVDSLVVVVGDHGESLGEHKESGHGFFVYDATVLVPFLLRLPSKRHRGTRVATPVESIDILPTVLEVLDIPVPEDVQGRSLMSLIRGESGGGPRYTYFESFFPLYRYGWSSLRGVRTATHKYIEAPRPELYDLIADPREEDNVYEQNPELARELEERLRDPMFAGNGETQTPQLLDDETLDKLMALGYVGGFHASLPEEGANRLPDPKDKIGIYNRIRWAEQSYAEGGLEEALAELQQVIEEDPDVPQARQVRAQILMKQERYQAAIEDCLAALETDPEYRAVLFTLAHAYKMKKQYSNSISVYEKLMGLDPKDYKPPLNLGKIYLERGEIDRAVSHLSQSIRLDPERSAMAHNLLGAAYAQGAMYAEAEQEIRKAIGLRPWIRDAHYNLGLIYDRKGDTEGAIRELRAEIELHPDSYLAHFHLARMYDQLGDPEGKIRHLQEAVRCKPDLANAYIMLGKSYLDLNRNLEEAVRLTTKGLELAPQPELIVFARFVLADIYNRLGRRDQAEEERRKAEELQRRLQRR